MNFLTKEKNLNAHIVYSSVQDIFDFSQITYKDTEASESTLKRNES